MKFAPIQLDRYFVSKLGFEANSRFDPAKEPDFSESALRIHSTFKSVGVEEERAFEVKIQVKQEVPPESSNVPYSFCVEVVGVFLVHPNVEKALIKQLVATSGPNILYGAAREVIRDVTLKGPFPGFVIPAVVFSYPNKNKDAQGKSGATAGSKVDVIEKAPAAKAKA